MYAKQCLKYFFILSLLFFVSIFSIATLLSIKEDKYSVFKMTFVPKLTKLQPKSEPNQNYCKIEYISRNLNKYDTYIFGSSRVGKLPNEEIRNARVYNFTYSEGIPKEHLDNIKYLINKKLNIKTIIMGLDDFSYQIYPKEHHSELLRMPHPGPTNENKFLFLTKYIRYSFYDFTKYDPDKDIDFDLLNSGRAKPPKGLNEQIEKNKDTYIKDEKFNILVKKYPNIYRGEVIKELAEIKFLCDKHNINLILFINPIHKTTYSYDDKHALIKFKKELVKISPFWDFAYLNSITTNNYYFYETSHYRELVGRMILERFRYLNTKTAPSDFGKYVTKDNIENHIKFLENNYKNYK